MAKIHPRVPRATLRTKPAKAKVTKVMEEWELGHLHSGSKKGPIVTSQKQAVAIALSQAQKAARGR